MGIVIVMIVGAILGWLAAIVVERDQLVSSIANALTGAGGAIVAALIAGGVPLASGVSPEQLLWSVLGALAAIVFINMSAVHHAHGSHGVFHNRRIIGNHRTRP